MTEGSLGRRLCHALAVSALLSGPATLSAEAAEVVLQGIASDDPLHQTLLNASLLAEQAAAEAPTAAQEVVAAAQADYGRLVAVLYDAGFFGPVVTITLDGVDAANVPAVRGPSQVTQAVITVKTGPKFRFGAVQIGPLAPETQVPEGFAAGQTASLSVLKNTVAAGIDGWRAAGYAKARLAGQDLTARHATQEIDADITLAPGRKLRFGPLLVSGESKVRTERIIEIAGLPTGTVFSPDELRLAQARLRRTGAFNAVALLEADEIGPQDSLPITAQIADAPQRRFGFGAELSSLEGLTFSTFWLHRNLLGGAERLRLQAEAGGIGGNSGGEDYRISARFERPATFNEDTNFYALAKLAQLDEVNFFSRQFDLEAGIERIANENRTYRLGVGLRTAETRDAFGTNTFTLLTLPLEAEFDYRDVALDPKEGFFFKFGATPFVALEGADHGLRTYVDARAYRTFGTERPVTLALRGQLGSVVGPELNVAPADYLFYSGGSDTVRGQAYQALGVDLGGGLVTGGRSFVGLQAEARLAVTDNIGVVGFADVGYIGSEEFFDGSGEWHSGAGLGLRYDTGIGPLRVDLGVPTSGPDSGEDFQIYIGIGQAF